MEDEDQLKYIWVDNKYPPRKGQIKVVKVVLSSKDHPKCYLLWHVGLRNLRGNNL